MPNNNDPVELAFRIGSFVKNDLEDRVICWWTKSWCPHVEGYVPGLGWVSAHQQTGKVDALPTLADIDNPAAWRRVTVPYRWTNAAIHFVEETIGALYDYLSIVDFVLHDGLLAKGKEICSRFWRDVLDRCEWSGDGERPQLVPNPSPGDLVRIFLPNLICDAAQATITPDTITLSREELRTLCRPPVAGLFGIDSEGINTAAAAVKALCDDARAKLDALDPQITAVISPIAKLAAVLDVDKIINLMRAKIRAGQHTDFLKG